MLSRLGEQRYASFWEGRAGGGRPSAPLSAWVQGHRLTPRPCVSSCGLHVLPSCKVGVRTQFTVSNGGGGACWGLSHRLSGDRLGSPASPQAPCFLPQKCFGKRPPPRVPPLCDLFSGVWDPSPTWLLPTLGGSHGTGQLLASASLPHLSAPLAPSISAPLTPWLYLNTRSPCPPQGLCTYGFFQLGHSPIKLSKQSGPWPTLPIPLLCFISPHDMYHPQPMSAT